MATLKQKLHTKGIQGQIGNRKENAITGGKRREKKILTPQ